MCEGGHGERSPVQAGGDGQIARHVHVSDGDADSHSRQQRLGLVQMVNPAAGREIAFEMDVEAEQQVEFKPTHINLKGTSFPSWMMEGSHQHRHRTGHRSSGARELQLLTLCLFSLRCCSCCFQSHLPCCRCAAHHARPHGTRVQGRVARRAVMPLSCRQYAAHSFLVLRVGPVCLDRENAVSGVEGFAFSLLAHVSSSIALLVHPSLSHHFSNFKRS